MEDLKSSSWPWKDNLRHKIGRKKNLLMISPLPKGKEGRGAKKEERIAISAMVQPRNIFLSILVSQETKTRGSYKRC